MHKKYRKNLNHFVLRAFKALRTTHREYLYGLIIAIVYMALVLIWRSIDQRPPNWDMARHLYTGEVYSRLLSGQHWLDLAWHYMYYPPLLYIWVAKWQALIGHSVISAVASNLLWVGIIVGSMISIGRCFQVKYAGLAASAFFFTMPLIGSVVRDFQIDIPLTAMVALTLVCLIRSRRFTSFRWSVASGILFGLGMLTKWTYPAFVALPALIVVLVGLSAKRDRHVVLQNIITSAAVGAVIAQPWYVKNIDALRGDFAANGSVAGVNEGDPAVWTAAGWLWYPLAILRDYLWLPWLVPVVGAFMKLAWHRPIYQWVKNVSLESLVLLSSSLGGLLCFTLLRNKDARYIMPIFIGVSILVGLQLASWLRNHATQLLAYVIGVLIVISYLATSFVSYTANNINLTLGPVTWWRASGYITGAPEPAIWCQAEAFREARSRSSTVVYRGPDTIWFNGWGNMYYAAQNGLILGAGTPTVVIERSANRSLNAAWECRAADGSWVTVSPSQ